MLLRKPLAVAIDRFLDAQRELPFTYDGVGATAGTCPEGYVVDHTRRQLGSGDEVFESAVQALRRWDQFKLGWVESFPDNAPIQEGTVVAVLGHTLQTYWLNACRIVYVINPQSFAVDSAGGRHKQFGFAYGTLPGHAESGEERFLIDMLPDGTVWYDIVAFSRPRHFLARWGKPLVRRLQKRFGRDSAAAMVRAVGAE